MADVSLVWEGTLEPIGTLFLDDLEELDKLLGTENSTVEWSLQGRRELGSAKVTATTISELVELRNQIMDPKTLELEVREHDYDVRPATRFTANVRVSEAWRRGEDGAWKAAISATGEHRDRFERSVRGLTEIFERAAQTTWARQHKTFHSMVDNVSFSLLWLGAIVLALFLSEPLGRWVAAPVVAWVLVIAGLVLVKRRLDSNATWEPPRFDLRNKRSRAQLAAPPEVLNRDILVTAVFAVATLIGGTIVAAILT